MTSLMRHSGLDPESRWRVVARHDDYASDAVGINLECSLVIFDLIYVVLEKQICRNEAMYIS